MKVYIIQIQLANGDTETKYSTEDRQYAAFFCKSLNEKSPNRYFFKEVELEDVELEDVEEYGY